MHTTPALERSQPRRASASAGKVVLTTVLGNLLFISGCNPATDSASNGNANVSAGGGVAAGASAGGAGGANVGAGGATPVGSSGAPGSGDTSAGVAGATGNAGQGGAAQGGSTAGGGSSGLGGASSSPGGEGSVAGAGGGGVQTGGTSSTGGSDASGGSAGAGQTATTSLGCDLSPPESGRRTIDVDGSAREYILRVPDDYQADVPHKLIFAFHARGGNATQVAGSGNDDYYGLYRQSDGSAIFVSPEGLDAGWRNTDGRDIAFVRAMLDTLSAELCIDSARIFSTGFSFGGMMSDAIGCAMADVFRAIAPMAGAVPNPEHPYSGCDQLNQHPIAVWMAHGDNDTTVPLADGMDALEIFLTRSECGTETAPVDPSPCVEYQGCLADYPIRLCQFSGGHQVPSFAAEGIWNFFNQF